MRHSFSFLLTLRPSRRLSALLFLTYLLATACVLFATIPLLGKAVFLGAIGVSLLRARRSELPADYRFFHDGRIEKVGDGDTARAGHCVDWTMLGPMMVVQFRHPAADTHLVALQDSFASADEYRRLRLWLKWQAKTYKAD